MADLSTWIILGFFGVSTAALAVYGLHMYVLLWLFRRREKSVRTAQRESVERYRATTADEAWPVVTSQIPIYNELDVAERIVRAVAEMDYPDGKHEIQVLDDSNDRTSHLLDVLAEELGERGVEIQILRRDDRRGYKAGALAEGVAKSRGEYLSVFDADFVPPRDFLRRAIPLLAENPNLACLQGRWAHINQEESWLTRAQAVGIDGHFAIEQGARAWNGLLMNFNGTAGIWRKAAIVDPEVGGWSGDTLTEDLDLSYRAQLAGWRIDYCLDLACPAELPGDINAFKSQQRRWATGSIQVAVKLLPRIWRAPLTLGQKIEASLHLTHYSVAVWMLLLALVARPMLFVWMGGRVFDEWFWVAWTVILLAAVAPSLTYGYGRWSLGGGWSGFRLIPQLIILGCGMCLNNGLAVLRGLSLRGGEFVRTPKSGNSETRRQNSSYATIQSNLWWAELVLGVYSLVCFAHYIETTKWAFSIFLLFYGLGFLAVGWSSRPQRPRVAAKESPDSGIAVTPASPGSGML